MGIHSRSGCDARIVQYSQCPNGLLCWSLNWRLGNSLYAILWRDVGWSHYRLHGQRRDRYSSSNEPNTSQISNDKWTWSAFWRSDTERLLQLLRDSKAPKLIWRPSSLEDLEDETDLLQLLCSSAQWFHSSLFKRSICIAEDVRRAPWNCCALSAWCKAIWSGIQEGLVYRVYFGRQEAGFHGEIPSHSKSVSFHRAYL